jgi:GT2 family glycosyltransferase
MSEEAEVVIPHWNRAASLARALDALRAQTRPVAVTVVDNGSDDGSVEMLAADYPEVRCLSLERNLGFGAAVNRGIAISEARVVILLNNDTVADERFVERLLEAQAADGAEMVAACLRAPAGPIESLGVEIDRSLVAYDVWHGERYERLVTEAPSEPLAPSAGAAAYLRQALDRVGGFDEQLFAYLEDVELGIRMRLAGMRCATAPAAFAWHEHSATLGSGARAKNRLMGRSRTYLLWKHGGGLRPRERARGAIIDSLVYAGQALIDRNLGAPSGRLEMRRELAGRPRPAAEPRMATVPKVERRLSEALRMRLARRLPRA